MPRRLLPILLILACLPFGACNPPPPPPSPPNFTQYQPISLNVASIEVSDAYHSPANAPELQFPTSPREAMHLWVKERLRAVGSENTLQVIIHDAGVHETRTPDGDIQYHARLAVELRIYGDQPLSAAKIHVEATRSETVPGDAGEAERASVQSHMVKVLMDEANAELEKNIYQYFSAYVTYPEYQAE